VRWRALVQRRLVHRKAKGLDSQGANVDSVPSKRDRSMHLAKEGSLPNLAYRTRLGRAYHTTVESFLASPAARAYRGRVDLILTSPPFPLNRKKAYGNFTGPRYLEWLQGLAPELTSLLRPRGSIVIELGNAWEPGAPVMSTLTTRALLAFLDAGKLKLCQEFVGYNKARLPSPAQWVNVERIRVKDAYTHIWWMSRVARPLASNRRVLKEYSPAMLELLKTGKYTAGRRPSEAVIGETSFNKNNRGAIPPNVLEYANTAATGDYLAHCEAEGIDPHPARMHADVARFFVKFLTMPGGLVLDPFAGSNTTGAAAQGLMRRWVSLERDADYLRGSLGRF
jgi:DNA modification methylase